MFALTNLTTTHHITKGDYKSLKAATCLLNSSEGKIPLILSAAVLRGYGVCGKEAIKKG